MTTDLAKLRDHLRKMRRQTIFAMLDDAVGLLPKAKLELLVKRHLHPPLVQKEASEARSKPRLLAEVTDYAARSRRGDYFESFNVNSKNCTEESNGTVAWIAECNRMLGRCIARAKVGRGRAETLAAFEILFDLIDLAASCELDILFFADEGGLWSFGIDWRSVFQAWATCAAHIEVDDEAFEARVTKLLTRFGRGEPGMTMAMARRVRNAAKAADKVGPDG